jgi:tRNA/rRNA methyltransferase
VNAYGRAMTEETEPQTDEAPAAIPPVVILVEPQLGENIGMAARAMANFGLSELRLVKPRDGWPQESASKAASGALFIIEGVRVFARLEEAIGDLTHVYATTARARGMLKPVATPETAAREMHEMAAAGGRCGLMFGRERWGLENDEVALADALCIAPVNPQFASLNIAQAVLLLGYEWFKQREVTSLGRVTRFEKLAGEGLGWREDATRPATKQELIGFFEHLEGALDAVGFFWPPEKRPSSVRNLRNIFHRLQATEQDVRTLRGVVAALAKGPSGKR